MSFTGRKHTVKSYTSQKKNRRHIRWGGQSKIVPRRSRFSSEVLYLLVLCVALMLCPLEPHAMVSATEAIEAGKSKAAPPDTSFLKTLKKLAGKGAVGVWNLEGQALLVYQPLKRMIAASTWKIITASAFLYHCGPDYRFPTEFFVDHRQNLYVKGYGDPLLTSEEWRLIAGELYKQGLRKVNRIILDGSWFASPLTIPGTGHSANPYDAPVAALSTNFNTIHVTYKKGRWHSAEPQTPLTPFIAKRAAEYSTKGSFRMPLNRHAGDAWRLTGSLLTALLRERHIEVKGVYRPGSVPEDAIKILDHYSRLDAAEIVAAMLKYSNNFMANQLFLSLGALVKGPPANMQKSRQVLSTFLCNQCGVCSLPIAEGSGISPQNRLTINEMHHVLTFFFPFKKLLVHKEGHWIKTGTLRAARTLAGYFASGKRPDTYRAFVILLPGANDNREAILELLQKNF